jgi:hypothetical protein
LPQGRPPSSPNRPAMHALRRLFAGLLLTLAPVAVLSASPQEPDAPPAETEPEILGAAAAFGIQDTESETLRIPANTPLYRTPSPDASQITLIDSLTELAVLEHQGGWSKVLYSDRLGWVNPELSRADMTLVSAPSSIEALMTAPSMLEIERRIRIAGAVLGVDGPAGRLGPYALMTDITNPRLLDRIREIASSLDSVYQERYGLPVGDTGLQTVALFATEAAYRDFEAKVTDGNDLSARGHAGGNLAALFVEDQRLDDVLELVIHELTHLLNRRAFGEAIAPWLEEGLANDLCYSDIDRTGRLKAGTLSGRRIQVGARASRTVVYEGPFASLTKILSDRFHRQTTPIQRLIEMGREEFLRAQDRESHYIESTFLVRFLLDSSKQRYAPAFQSYLAEVAAGGMPDATRLIELLGTDLRQLELGLDAYLRVQAAYLAP